LEKKLLKLFNTRLKKKYLGKFFFETAVRGKPLTGLRSAYPEIPVDKRIICKKSSDPEKKLE
jgi:hypothetical protein